MKVSEAIAILRAKTERSKVGNADVVGAPSASRIDFRSHGADALPVDIERPQNIRRIESQVRLNVLEGSHRYKK